MKKKLILTTIFSIAVCGIGFYGFHVENTAAPITSRSPAAKTAPEKEIIPAKKTTTAEHTKKTTTTQRTPIAPDSWQKLNNKSLKFSERYGRVQDIQVSFVGHPTPWKRMISVQSNNAETEYPILIEEQLDSEGKVVARIPMIGNHLIVQLKKDRPIEELTNRIPEVHVIQPIESMSAYLVGFEASDAETLNKIYQNLFDQTDLVTVVTKNILHDAI